MDVFQLRQQLIADYQSYVTSFMALRDDGLYAITHFSRSVEGASTDINGVRSYSSISVVFTGDGSEIRVPMAVTVIAGLGFSTVLTLVVIPTMWAWVSNLRGRTKIRTEEE